MHQELIGGAIFHGPAQGFPLAGFLDEPPLQQKLHGIIALYPPHGLDFRPGGGLAIGDDGEGLHHGLGQGLFFQGLQEGLHPGGPGGIYAEIGLGAAAVQPHAPAVFHIRTGHVGEHIFHFPGGEVHGMGQGLHVDRIAGHKQNGLHRGHGFGKLHGQIILRCY